MKARWEGVDSAEFDEHFALGVQFGAPEEVRRILRLVDEGALRARSPLRRCLCGLLEQIAHRKTGFMS